MSHDVALACRCGSITGTARGLSPSTGVRLVCYCPDCQTYAHHLGHPETVLDASGGTEVMQTTPHRITIERGHEHLRCLRQSKKGPLRWYAGCCGTPIANVLPSPKVPFAALVGPFMVFDSKEARTAALGPVRAAVQTKARRGPLPYPEGGAGVIARSLGRIALAYLRGQQRPTPFFDDDGRPVAPVEQMDLETRRRLQAEVRALGGA